MTPRNFFTGALYSINKQERKADSKLQKLKADIKNRQFKNCYLFYGEEDYLKRLYRDSLKAAVLNGGDDMLSLIHI